MKLITMCFFLCTSQFVYSQTKLILGNKDSLYSNILHEDRKIWVHLPEELPDPDGNIFAKQRYPVIYLLDGWEANFSVVSSIVSQLGGGNGNLSFPQLIVVGIPNTDRTRDLTPTHSSMPMMDSEEAGRSGGGEKFISFLEKELIPHIDSLYPTAPYRVLIGHSLGGLMSVYTLVKHSALFNAYIAIDPSTIWDNKLVVMQTKEALGKKQFKNNFLFLAIANTMNSGVDTSIIGFHMRTNFQLRDLLNGYQGNDLVFDSKYYPDYDHNSVPIVAEYDGLRAIFSVYDFNFPFSEFFDTSYKADTLLSRHYENISRRMGYRVLPPEQFVNAIAYQLRDMKQFDRAYYFLKMNIDNYPQSFNAYDEMGDFFNAKGDKQKAIEFYSKSLSLHNSPDTEKKIKKLKGMK